MEGGAVPVESITSENSQSIPLLKQLSVEERDASSLSACMSVKDPERFGGQMF